MRKRKSEPKPKKKAAPSRPAHRRREKDQAQLDFLELLDAYPGKNIAQLARHEAMFNEWASLASRKVADFGNALSLSELVIDFFNLIKEYLESDTNIVDFLNSTASDNHFLNKLRTLKPQQYKDISTQIARAERIMKLTKFESILNHDHDNSMIEHRRKSDLYKSRPDKSESAVAFLERVWGSELRSGTLYQFQLRQLDPELLVGLRNYAHHQKISVNTLVPPQKRFTEAVIANDSGATILERAKAAEALARRLGRAARKQSHNPT